MGACRDYMCQNNLIGFYLEGGRSELLYIGPLKNSPVCNGPCGGIVNWRLTAQLEGGKAKSTVHAGGWNGNAQSIWHENGGKKKNRYSTYPKGI